MSESEITNSKKSYPLREGLKRAPTRPERVIDHRGISKTVREWAEFTGKSKASIQSLERNGYLSEHLDFHLRNKGLLP